MPMTPVALVQLPPMVRLSRFPAFITPWLMKFSGAIVMVPSANWALMRPWLMIVSPFIAVLLIVADEAT